MNEHFDDLDRALFALPLATPPADLREAILRATVRAPAAATPPVPFTWYEVAGIGIALAIAAWLVLAAVADHRFAAAMSDDAYAIVRELATPTTLVWTTTGGAVAALWTLANFTPLPRSVRKS